MRRVLSIILCMAVAGCAVSPGTPPHDAAIAPAPAAPGENLHPPGLRISMNDVSTDGRVAKIRGLVRNDYAEPVEGVRYVVIITNDAGTALDHWQYEADTTIDAGDRTMMRLDVESMYWGRAGETKFVISATPAKLGGKDVPPPPEWK